MESDFQKRESELPWKELGAAIGIVLTDEEQAELTGLVRSKLTSVRLTQGAGHRSQPGSVTANTVRRSSRLTGLMR